MFPGPPPESGCVSSRVFGKLHKQVARGSGVVSESVVVCDVSEARDFASDSSRPEANGSAGFRICNDVSAAGSSNQACTNLQGAEVPQGISSQTGDAPVGPVGTRWG